MPWSLQILTHEILGLDGEIAQEESVGDGREGGTVKRWSGGETEVFTAVKTFYTFKTRSLRVRSGVSGKPGVSGLNPGYSAPLNPASRFSRNLILNGFGRFLM
jgi:hypothetical protein